MQGATENTSKNEDAKLSSVLPEEKGGNRRERRKRNAEKIQAEKIQAEMSTVQEQVSAQQLEVAEDRGDGGFHNQVDAEWIVIRALPRAPMIYSL
jgi:hypothetical protein